jgi:hypothetical protein
MNTFINAEFSVSSVYENNVISNIENFYFSKHITHVILIYCFSFTSILALSSTKFVTVYFTFLHMH